MNDEFVTELWSYANEVPMLEHPWFAGILDHRWTPEQIVLGEVQHYLRVCTNPIYFGYIAINATRDQRYPGLAEIVLENFMEEFAGAKSHMDIMYQFLEEAGISRDEADRAEPTPGTLACIEMLIGCCEHRSALEGVAMLAFVESQHGGGEGVASKIYRELVGHYAFSPRAAETYRLHGEQDEGHGSRQIDAIRQFATDEETRERVRRAVKLGVTAYNLEWDGHVQAMTGRREFWPGHGLLQMTQPRVRLPATRR